jgi:hypothetical protein
MDASVEDVGHMRDRIEETLGWGSCPEEGGRAGRYVAKRIRDNWLDSDREVVSGALRQYLNYRPSESDHPREVPRSRARIGIAMVIADELQLFELIPELWQILRDIKMGRLDAIGADTVQRYIDRLSKFQP